MPEYEVIHKLRELIETQEARYSEREQRWQEQAAEHVGCVGPPNKLSQACLPRSPGVVPSPSGISPGSSVQPVRKTCTTSQKMRLPRK